MVAAYLVARYRPGSGPAGARVPWRQRLITLRGVAPVLALRLPRARLEQWLRPAPGQQLEDHLYLVDPMGEWMMRPPASPEPSKLKRDLDRLLRASAAWDRPGR
jgi:hypothetical protein